MPKGKALYHEYPDYEVALDSNPARVRVTFHGEVVVDSSRTLVVRETGHTAVVYFPREDVRFEWLERSDNETFCPFKGEASYWNLRVREHSEANAVWSYEDPFEQVAGLAGYLAFLPDREGLLQE
ncbi:MAG: DUF427 domain-containing protein [Deltaproteobacteria bacterium]|nr:DUF427 domain-containing protein [Deltaproteobacteria bacterium]MBW2360218.1 DUF427 domain-containing protein [Deltaproteobacteria bacterium]